MTMSLWRHIVTLWTSMLCHFTWMWSLSEMTVESLWPFSSLFMTSHCDYFVKSPCDNNIGKCDICDESALGRVLIFYMNPVRIVLTNIFFSAVCDIYPASGCVTWFYSNTIQKVQIIFCLARGLQHLGRFYIGSGSLI